MGPPPGGDPGRDPGRDPGGDPSGDPSGDPGIDADGTLRDTPAAKEAAPVSPEPPEPPGPPGAPGDPSASRPDVTPPRAASAPAEAPAPTDAEAEAAAARMRRSWREPKRLAVSLLGFAAGIALLAWVIARAVGDEEARAGWDRMLDASPWLVAAMLACTLASSVVNALAFQLTARPIGGVSGWDLQRLNFVAGFLNYLPIRLGPLARIGWHLTVDRMRVLALTGWFAVMAIMVILVLGPAMVATFARPQLDWIWGLLLVAQIVVVVLMLRWTGALVLRRHGRDAERILQAPGVLWGAAVLRLLDVAAFWGRMWAAAAILGMAFTPGELLMLALVAYVGSLVPFGRAGFQQFLVASAAGWIQMDADALGAGMAQLALLESAAEFGFYLVTGAIFLPWYRAGMTRAAEQRRAEKAAAAAAAQDSPAGEPSPAAMMDDPRR